MANTANLLRLGNAGGPGPQWCANYTSGHVPFVNPTQYTMPCMQTPQLKTYTRADAVRDFRQSLYRGSGDTDLELHVNQLPDASLIARGPDATPGWLDAPQPADPCSGVYLWQRHG